MTYPASWPHAFHHNSDVGHSLSCGFLERNKRSVSQSLATVSRTHGGMAAAEVNREAEDRRKQSTEGGSGGEHPKKLANPGQEPR